MAAVILLVAAEDRTFTESWSLKASHEYVHSLWYFSLSVSDAQPDSGSSALIGRSEADGSETQAAGTNSQTVDEFHAAMDSGPVLLVSVSSTLWAFSSGQHKLLLLLFLVLLLLLLLTVMEVQTSAC